MILLFEVPERQYNNQTFDTGRRVINDYVDVTTITGIQAFVNITAIDPGEQIVITHALYIGGVFMAGAAVSLAELGRSSVGLMRSDLDATAEVQASVQVIGKITAGAQVYAILQGEDVPE